MSGPGELDVFDEAIASLKILLVVHCNSSTPAPVKFEIPDLAIDKRKQQIDTNSIDATQQHIAIPLV